MIQLIFIIVYLNRVCKAAFKFGKKTPDRSAKAFYTDFGVGCLINGFLALIGVAIDNPTTRGKEFILAVTIGVVFFIVISAPACLIAWIIGRAKRTVEPNPPVEVPENLYLLLNGEQQGPYPAWQIVQMLNERIITSETLCWREGMETWQPISTINKSVAG